MNSIVATSAICVVLLAGCGSQNANSSKSGSNASKSTNKSQSATKSTSSNSKTTITKTTIGGGQTKINFWNGITGGNEPGFLKWLSEYKNPDITIQAQNIPWAMIYQKLPSAFNGGDPPQLFMLHNTDLNKYAKEGLLEPLDDVGQALVTKQTLQTNSVWKSNAFYGHQYAIPVGLWDEDWYYNKDMWKKIGYPSGPPLNNPTKLIAALQKLTVTKNGKTVQWGLGLDTLDDAYETLVLQAGGQAVGTSNTSYDSTASKKALQYLHDLVYKYKVTPNPSGEDDNALFEQGKLALTFQGEWNIPAYESYKKSGGKLNWGVTSAPVVMIPGGQPKTLVGGPSFAIAKSSDNTSAMVKQEKSFIKWAIPTETKWAVNGGLLPVTTSPKIKSALKKDPKLYNAYTTLLAGGVARQVNPSWATLDNKVEIPMVQKVMETGSNVNINQVAKNAQQQAKSAQQQ